MVQNCCVLLDCFFYSHNVTQRAELHHTEARRCMTRHHNADHTAGFSLANTQEYDSFSFLIVPTVLALFRLGHVTEPSDKLP